ncbi:MAG: hypothetical protein PHS56_04695 [Eubacteriales bacterium]|nr:hypothetical protein [Eubacteriales bacterium]MDD3073714.1 hypothetical protein [Eubacteriales bacterium]MDD4146630.1 hypothetical protein [Clostridia bacterium]
MFRRLVVWFLILLYITLPLSVKGYSEGGIKVTGEKRYQLNAGKQICDGSVTDATIKLNHLNFTQGGLGITGSVRNGQREIPFDISGNIFKSNLFPGTYVFEATDLLNNFEVAYLAITQDAKSLYKKSLLLSENIIFQMYLLDKDTLEFFTFETPFDMLKTKENVNQYYFYAEVLPENKAYIEHWWVNVFLPEVAEVPQSVGINGVPNEKEINLTLSWDYTVNVKYEISIKSRMCVYSHPDPGPDIFTLQVTSQKIFVDGVLYATDLPYLFIVGCQAKIQMKNYSLLETNDDIFRSVSWHTLSDAPSSPPVSWGVSLGIGVGPISASGGLSWSPQGSPTMDPGGFDNFFPSQKVQGVNLQLGRYINEVGDKFNITLWKDRYSSCPKKMQVVYLFNVAWGNHITIVIPSRTLSTVVTYY